MMVALLVVALTVEVSGFFQNFAIFKSDTDFDPTPASYEPWGQTASVIATYAEPLVRFNLSPRTYIVWEGLFGFNVWGRNTVIQRPEEAGVLGNQIFFVQRQIYAGWEGDVKVSVGYQYFEEPAQVFLRHWVAGVRVETKNLSFIFAQIPDQTREGFTLTENNLLNDVFLAGIQGKFKSIFAGAWGLADFKVIGRPRATATLLLGSSGRTQKSKYLFAVYGQAGVWSKSADGAENERRVAGALVLDGEIKPGFVGIGATLSALSGGASPGSTQTNSFLWSGKLPNRTLLLTEDEIVFRGDNLDIAVSERASGFFIARAGAVTGDLRLVFGSETFLLTLVGGILTTLDDRSFDENFVAGEVSAIASVKRENWLVDVALTLLRPGKKGGIFVNSQNPFALRPFIFAGEVSVKLFF